jgi:hypothetical protein
MTASSVPCGDQRVLVPQRNMGRRLQLGRRARRDFLDGKVKLSTRAGPHGVRASEFRQRKRIDGRHLAPAESRYPRNITGRSRSLGATCIRVRSRTAIPVPPARVTQNVHVWMAHVLIGIEPIEPYGDIFPASRGVVTMADPHQIPGRPPLPPGVPVRADLLLFLAA